MSTDHTDQTHPAGGAVSEVRTARWVKIALFISLAINLLVVGTIAGRVAMGSPYFRGGPDGLHESRSEAWQMLRELPRERRGMILDRMHSHRDSFDEHREKIGAARRRAAEIIERQETSDEDIRGAMEALGREEAEGVIALRSVIGDVAIIMTPEERRMFAKRILGREWRGFGPRWSHDGH